MQKLWQNKKLIIKMNGKDAFENDTRYYICLFYIIFTFFDPGFVVRIGFNSPGK